jgi:hypothetical protein
VEGCGRGISEGIIPALDSRDEENHENLRISWYVPDTNIERYRYTNLLGVTE